MTKPKRITKTFRKGAFIAPWEDAVTVTALSASDIEAWKARRAARLASLADDERNRRAEEHAQLAARVSARRSGA